MTAMTTATTEVAAVGDPVTLTFSRNDLAFQREYFRDWLGHLRFNGAHATSAAVTFAVRVLAALDDALDGAPAPSPAPASRHHPLVAAAINEMGGSNLRFRQRNEALATQLESERVAPDVIAQQIRRGRTIEDDDA
jgi:hypothetical protein